MATNATIISTGASDWPLEAAPPAWAHAVGINEFMDAPDFDEVSDPKSPPQTPGGEGAALCHRVRQGPPRSRITGRESAKSALIQGLADGAHQLQVEMQVVQGVQPATQNLAATVQVPQIGARIVGAGVAAALR